jgi:hypothetical protein
MSLETTPGAASGTLAALLLNRAGAGVGNGSSQRPAVGEDVCQPPGRKLYPTRSRESTKRRRGSWRF